MGEAATYASARATLSLCRNAYSDLITMLQRRWRFLIEFGRERVADGGLLLGALAALSLLPALLIGSVHPQAQLFLLAFSRGAMVLLALYPRQHPYRSLF